MAHFAKLDNNHIVLAVHSVNNDVITIDGVESEVKGIEFLINLHNHEYWRQTSYNGNFRKNYAGIGYTYDVDRDAFIAPKPYESWILNEDTCQWESPIPHPNDGKFYVWSESDQQWTEVINTEV